MPRGGKRPGAGRKSNFDESLRDKCLSECWKHLEQRMSDPATTREEKDRISLVLCPKTIKQTAEVKSDVSGGMIIKWASNG